MYVHPCYIFARSILCHLQAESIEYTLSKCSSQLSLFSSLFTCTDLQPYLLFADGVDGIIYRSNLKGSDIQQLVRGLPGPFALDFDYRYTVQASTVL